MKADKEALASLCELLDEAAGPLPDVTRKKMFACEARFVTGNIFALIWKTGRIGVRLPDPALYADALARPGAEPWNVHDDGDGKPMAHWVLLPEADHDDMATLGGWVGQAHALAMALGPKPEKPEKPEKKARS